MARGCSGHLGPGWGAGAQERPGRLSRFLRRGAGTLPRRERSPGLGPEPGAGERQPRPAERPQPRSAAPRSSSPLQTPSSDFWKELCLALPRKVSFPGTVGDPQTQLQEDKDPMLILHSSYLDSAGDLHPDGDLGTGPWPRRLRQMCAGGHLWALRHPPVAGGMGSAPSPPLRPLSLQASEGGGSGAPSPLALAAPVPPWPRLPARWRTRSPGTARGPRSTSQTWDHATTVPVQTSTAW